VQTVLRAMATLAEQWQCVGKSGNDPYRSTDCFILPCLDIRARRAEEMNMAAHDFAEFSWDEQADVKAVLTSRGFALIEFKITDKEDALPSEGKTTVRQVSVTRITNGKTEIYDTDHFAPWITDFDEALQAGKFDD
jgi:hypothetical protein